MASKKIKVSKIIGKVSRAREGRPTSVSLRRQPKRTRKEREVKEVIGEFLS